MRPHIGFKIETQQASNRRFQPSSLQPGTLKVISSARTNHDMICQRTRKGICVMLDPAKNDNNCF
jgi:hypothetical protein